MMHSKVLENPHIGSQSYLSSDYLNLFTEIVILLEEVVGHPGYLDDVREWKAISYCDHFRASSLPFSDLAIWAYDHAPSESLDKFNTLTGRAVDLITACQTRVAAAGQNGSLDDLGDWLSEHVAEIRSLLDQAGVLIDRNEHHLSQSDVDRLLKS